MWEALDDAVEHLCPRRFTQCGKLFEGIFGLKSGAFRIDPDEDNFFEAKLPIFNFGNVLELGGEPTNAPKCLAFLQVHIAGGDIPQWRSGCTNLATKHADVRPGFALLRKDAVNGVRCVGHWHQSTPPCWGPAVNALGAASFSGLDQRKRCWRFLAYRFDRDCVRIKALWVCRTHCRVAAIVAGKDLPLKSARQHELTSLVNAGERLRALGVVPLTHGNLLGGA